jgi:hypothetical protein
MDVIHGPRPSGPELHRNRRTHEIQLRSMLFTIPPQLSFLVSYRRSLGGIVPASLAGRCAHRAPDGVPPPVKLLGS